MEQIYQAALTRASDIHEHLPVLREYASRCEHVTEMGLRWATGSTIAFLAAQPKKLISWDIEPAHVVSDNVRTLLQHKGATAWEPRCGNTLEIPPIEPTDLLFIDTLHTFKQLFAELMRHGDSVRKWIVFHDTDTFGYKDEDGGDIGLRMAIHKWQKEERFPLWRLVYDSRKNNGLSIIQHARVD
jgi:hypothetical protein